MSEVADTSNAAGVIHAQTEKLMRKSREALDAIYLKRRPQDSLTIFVASYILLHNLEAIFKRERGLARRTRAPVRFCVSPWRQN